MTTFGAHVVGRADESGSFFALSQDARDAKVANLEVFIFDKDIATGIGDILVNQKIKPTFESSVWFTLASGFGGEFSRTPKNGECSAKQRPAGQTISKSSPLANVDRPS